MAIEPTIEAIIGADSWPQRIRQLQLVPRRHGIENHQDIYAAVARALYLPHLAPDFAYIYESSFYEAEHFFQAYTEADRLTTSFTQVAEVDLTVALLECPRALLVFRTLLGLTKEEFAQSTVLAGAAINLGGLTPSQVDRMERSTIPIRRPTTPAVIAKAESEGRLAARTITMVMNGSLFGEAPDGLKTKQSKPDTADGWNSVRSFAVDGVPLKVFLHQRHYGGAFRQVLDATSGRRGDMLEDAVEALFTANRISFVRTGTGGDNQAEIVRRFEIRVTPAPDFVVFDPIDGSLKALLECKGTNNGGTARDKAPRFASLRAEAIRLGGIPLIAALAGMGWARINDALGPVVRDTEGRVFTPSTLASMMDVQPFPSLRTQGLAAQAPE
jgi:hypothetical protein